MITDWFYKRQKFDSPKQVSPSELLAILMATVWLRFSQGICIGSLASWYVSPLIGQEVPPVAVFVGAVAALEILRGPRLSDRSPSLIVFHGVYSWFLTGMGWLLR